MAIRRQKIDRKPVSVQSHGGTVINLAPDWSFTLLCPHHGPQKFNFNALRVAGRENLAAHMRDAVWSLRSELEAVTLASYVRFLARFWLFLDELSGQGEHITSLAQITRSVIERFLAWMERQIIVTTQNHGQPWSIGTRRTAYKALKSLLVARQKRVPDEVSDQLTFPRNPFPNANQQATKRQPYSDNEQRRLLGALNQDLRSIHEGIGAPLSDLQGLVVHLLLLGLATGINQQPLLELTRDSLRAHPLPDRELLVTSKRRGYSVLSTSIRTASDPAIASNMQTIPATIGEHFRFLCQFTSPLVSEADPNDQEYVFLRRGLLNERKGRVFRLTPRDAKNAIKVFMARHNLTDDRGRPLQVWVARLRPTFATELYRRTRDIRRVQRALGHASVSTTARHYVDMPIEAERDHAFVLDSMVGGFTRQDVSGKVLIAADGLIPVSDIKNLLTGGYNTGVARCRNPFRDDDSVCKKFFTCFRCPNMVVFEDDLWRLFSFYYRLLAERPKINAMHWAKTYAPIVRRIDTDIATQFPLVIVEEARRRAQASPHPTWRGSAV
ncbi:tyrosine-type recombinase/integrase [Paraburkholderia sabiae]|uniref:Tyrosine-type recombinase/integrase n=1 Tax=Paraburkholderia sabiae TaxID=273251 RepID=A0ABU9QKB9_9BURK|nr:tyrosine-type recombinase/integrase [Paraburkholderia sabiae]WJZ79774.1 tyrosine-type recombinase/integrase [Paraburkholderia sabiae]CAD6559295.1 Tyrosine recombinase XerC [Paraburkholderia sabiae]